MHLFTDEPVKVPDLGAIWKDPSYLDDNHKAQIAFQELLVVGKFDNDQTPTPIGAMCLNVERGRSDHSKLVVYARTQLDLEGHKGGSKITAWLDRSCRTLEEKRTEYVQQCEPADCSTPAARCVEKQCLYLAVQTRGVYVRHEGDTCGGLQVNSRDYPLILARQLIGEGASFALMRLLAYHKFVGQFETATLYLNGDICRNVYMCTGPESGIVNGKRMDVCKIYRKVIEKCGIIHVCSTTLTDTGRIVTHEWKDCDYVVYLNPMVELGPPSHPTQKKVAWHQDLQLFSTYLDRKQLCLSSTNSYLRDHPDIKQILSDYIQTMLQMKPEDVVKFTIAYFNRYSHE